MTKLRCWLRTILLMVIMTMGLSWVPFGVVWAGLNDGLVAYYQFNGNANDESGNGNNGVVHGATLTEDRFGNADHAYHFDGIDDFIQVDSTPLQKVHNSGEVSYTLWFEYTGVWGWLFHRGENYQCDYEPRISTSNVTLSGCNGSGKVVSFSPEIGWNHLAVVFSESNDIAVVYINGNSVANVSIATIKNASDTSHLIFNSQFHSIFIG